MVIDGRPASLTRRVTRNDGLPPHDIAAEEAVIAALLLDDDALWEVDTILRPEDFSHEQNRWAYEACLSLAGLGEPILITTLCHELDRRGLLDAAGGEAYYADILGKFFTAVGVSAHARIVARDAFYRRFIQFAGSLAQMAYEGGNDPQQLVDYARQSLTNLERRLTIRSVGTGIPVESVFSE